MIVGRVDSGVGELVELRAVEQQVRALCRRAQVAALDQRPAGTQPVQGACGITLGRVVDHVDAGDEPHLVEIRCHHRCDREQDGAQRIQGSGRQEWIAVHRRAHRIGHQWDGAVSTDVQAAAGIDDGLDDRA